MAGPIEFDLFNALEHDQQFAPPDLVLDPDVMAMPTPVRSHRCLTFKCDWHLVGRE